MQSPTDANDSPIEEMAADGISSGVEAEGEPVITHPFNPDKVFSVAEKRVPIQSLLNRIAQNRVRVPDLQRGERLWDNKRKSRLIESLMLRIPIPMFYASTDEEENWVIVDGLQRTRVIEDFVQPQKFENKLTLGELEYLHEYNGKTYGDLPVKYQNRITESELNFAIFGSDASDDLIRNIFKRLNTGGLPLSPQEIRHALYTDKTGKATNFLKKLAQSEEFIKATGNSVKSDRMADRELVLRLLAFYINDVDKYPANGDIDEFLSGTMKQINALNGESLASMEKDFIKAMNAASEIFGDRAFRKTTPASGNPRSPINKALFDSVGSILARLNDEALRRIARNRDAVYAAIENAMENHDVQLRNSISRYAQYKTAVKRRFDFFKKLFSHPAGE